MNITYQAANTSDIEPIYEQCAMLIRQYEQSEAVDIPKVLSWVCKKIETSIDEYTTIYADGQKAGYYHFYLNHDGLFELDDLYIFPEYQNRGIGTEVIKKCCGSVNAPVVLYVFKENRRAISLYERSGFKIVQTVRSTRHIMKNENRSPLL